MQWMPEVTFLCTYIAAALSGTAVLLLSDDPLSTRKFIGTVLLYGGLGMGLGMISYEYLGGQKEPWKVIACGLLVGVRVIRLQDVGALVRRILAVNTNGNGHTNNHKDKEE